MPRPTRIQYEHAYYHVMNRGRARQKIFHGEGYYKTLTGTGIVKKEKCTSLDKYLNKKFFKKANGAF